MTAFSFAAVILARPMGLPDRVPLAFAHAGQDPVSDDGPLPLGKHPRHLEHSPARRRPGVETLLVQEEVELLLRQPPTTSLW